MRIGETTVSDSGSGVAEGASGAAGTLPSSLSPILCCNKQVHSIRMTGREWSQGSECHHWPSDRRLPTAVFQPQPFVSHSIVSQSSRCACVSFVLGLLGRVRPRVGGPMRRRHLSRGVSLHGQRTDGARQHAGRGRQLRAQRRERTDGWSGAVRASDRSRRRGHDKTAGQAAAAEQAHTDGHTHRARRDERRVSGADDSRLTVAWRPCRDACIVDQADAAAAAPHRSVSAHDEQQQALALNGHCHGHSMSLHPFVRPFAGSWPSGRGGGGDAGRRHSTQRTRSGAGNRVQLSATYSGGHVGSVGSRRINGRRETNNNRQTGDFGGKTSSLRRTIGAL